MPKIISRQAIFKRPEKIIRTLNLIDFYEKRNKVLITRAVGGLGDILMHRMIFEDVKKLIPDCELHFACPMIYHDAVKDHPFVDKIFSSENINQREYIAHYNTTTICGRVEMQFAPSPAPHRSDIWSKHCGFTLKNHNMHIHLTDEEKELGKKTLEKYRYRDGPIVIICPISAMSLKNLLPHQLIHLKNILNERNCCAIGLHNHIIQELDNCNIPTIVTLGQLRLWMSILHEADYIISVDTSAFHCAGGMNKPTLGFFNIVNGKAYSQYYSSVEIMQGPCPLGHLGCYNISLCPKKGLPKPCQEGITNEMITISLDRLLQRFPIVI